MNAMKVDQIGGVLGHSVNSVTMDGTTRGVERSPDMRVPEREKHRRKRGRRKEQEILLVYLQRARRDEEAHKKLKAGKHLGAWLPDDFSVYERIALSVFFLRPSFELITVKRGGSGYQVPVPLGLSRQLHRAMVWLIEGAKERVKKHQASGLGQGLAQEVMEVLFDGLNFHEASKGMPQGDGMSDSKSTLQARSYAYGKRRATQRSAKTSRVFLHMRWR